MAELMHSVAESTITLALEKCDVWFGLCRKLGNCMVCTSFGREIAFSQRWRGNLWLNQMKHQHYAVPAINISFRWWCDSGCCCWYFLKITTNELCKGNRKISSNAVNTWRTGGCGANVVRNVCKMKRNDVTCMRTQWRWEFALSLHFCIVFSSVFRIVLFVHFACESQVNLNALLSMPSLVNRMFYAYKSTMAGPENSNNTCKFKDVQSVARPHPAVFHLPFFALVEAHNNHQQDLSQYQQIKTQLSGQFRKISCLIRWLWASCLSRCFDLSVPSPQFVSPSVEMCSHPFRINK